MPFRINSTGIEFPKWIVVLLLTLLMAGWGAWATVSFQARAALPRIEAASMYVTNVQHREDIQAIGKQLDIIRQEQQYTIQKLDRLLER